jgi:hypothetical protein
MNPIPLTPLERGNRNKESEDKVVILLKVPLSKGDLGGSGL